MNSNMGTVDRIFRALIAVVIAILYFTGIIDGTTGIILLVAGGIFLLTSVVGICPIYMALKLSTKRQRNREI